jgi:hypothetical protein
MQKINLQKIIDEHKLDKNDLANKLFPFNKFPDRALNNVLKGKTLLNSNQISALSLYTGLPIEQLYENTQWKHRIIKSQHVLESGEYKAILHLDGNKVDVYAKGTLLKEEILTNNLTTMKELINKIEQIIR